MSILGQAPYDQNIVPLIVPKFPKLNAKEMWYSDTELGRRSQEKFHPPHCTYLQIACFQLGVSQSCT
jgi:hypothetical protein